jgi:hypothetical protein
MNQQESQFDQNLERLIQASCGPETRPKPSAREQLHQRLSAELREIRRQEEFPAGILAVLSGVVLLLVAASFLSPSYTAVRISHGFELNPIGFVILVNLACLPIASLVIILRRKSCLSA